MACSPRWTAGVGSGVHDSRRDHRQIRSDPRWTLPGTLRRSAGRWTCRVVPLPGGLRSEIVPPSASSRSLRPMMPEPRRRPPPMPSSRTTRVRPSSRSSARMSTTDARVLGGVGECPGSRFTGGCQLRTGRIRRRRRRGSESRHVRWWPGTGRSWRSSSTAGRAAPGRGLGAHRPRPWWPRWPMPRPQRVSGRTNVAAPLGPAYPRLAWFAISRRPAAPGRPARSVGRPARRPCSVRGAHAACTHRRSSCRWPRMPPAAAWWRWGRIPPGG